LDLRYQKAVLPRHLLDSAIRPWSRYRRSTETVPDAFSESIVPDDLEDVKCPQRLRAPPGLLKPCETNLQRPDLAEKATTPDEPWLQVRSSRDFPAWMAEQRVSLAFRRAAD